MKKLFLLSGIISLSLVSCNQEPEGPVPAYDIETLEFANEDEELSYLMGVSVGASMNKDTMTDVNVDELSSAITDILNRNEFKIPVQDLERVQSIYQQKAIAERKSLGDTMSYAMGLNIGSSMAQYGIKEYDEDLFHFGMTSVFEDFELIYPEKENDSMINVLLMAKQKSLMAERQEAMMKAQNDAAVNFAENKGIGEDFLAKNALRSNVDTTNSGLQIEVIKAGKGPKPTGQNVVKVHYSGTLIDGTKFDSSYDRGEPYQTVVDGQIIRGWQEALKLMQVGGKYKIYVPQYLGYGFQDKGSIPPFSTLIFEMELVEIVK